MKELRADASGLRHLRWGREVLGSLRALTEVAELDGPMRTELLQRVEHLSSVVQTLSSAVKPYRDWLERERTLARGQRRVALGLARLALEIDPGRGASTMGHEEEALTEVLQRLDAREVQGGASQGAPLGTSTRPLLRSALDHLRTAERPNARRLGQALDEAVTRLRSELRALDDALATKLPPQLLEALWPDLSGEGTHVLDREDPHDDATRSA